MPSRAWYILAAWAVILAVPAALIVRNEYRLWQRSRRYELDFTRRKARS